jgi:HEAT repeat protein
MFLKLSGGAVLFGCQAVSGSRETVSISSPAQAVEVLERSNDGAKRQAAYAALSNSETVKSYDDSGREAITQQLYAQFRREGSPVLRTAALKALSVYPLLPEGALEIHQRAAKDQSSMVREQAAAGLARLDDPAAVKTLLTLARSDRSVEVRRAAIKALAVTGGSVGERDLLGLLRDPDLSIVEEASRTLAARTGRTAPAKFDAWASVLGAPASGLANRRAPGQPLVEPDDRSPGQRADAAFTPAGYRPSP